MRARLARGHLLENGCVDAHGLVAGVESDAVAFGLQGFRRIAPCRQPLREELLSFAIHQPGTHVPEDSRQCELHGMDDTRADLDELYVHEARSGTVGHRGPVAGHSVGERSE